MKLNLHQFNFTKTFDTFIIERIEETYVIISNCFMLIFIDNDGEPPCETLLNGEASFGRFCKNSFKLLGLGLWYGKDILDSLTRFCDSERISFL